MTDKHDAHHRHTKVFSTEKMKLTSSASEQNVYFTYVCLVDDLRPSGTRPSECENFDKQFNLLNKPTTEANQQEEPTIQVERTKALHELVETSKIDSQNGKTNQQTNLILPNPASTSAEDTGSENEDSNFISCDSPNILKLTKMKWLSEDNENDQDSSSPSLSPATSSTSSCSKNSDHDVTKQDIYDDKYLSTILRLDKEHNMFGLSSITIVGARPSKQKRTNKDDERAVFHQTAIVQVCCNKRCCRHTSKTDLPASLKCGGCRSCCFDINCAYCARAAVRALAHSDLDPPWPSACPTCPPPAPCNCGIPLPAGTGCRVDCCNNFGLKIKLNRKPKFEPAPVELTPRSSCVLLKPAAARPCSHIPRCQPPSSCFPYLMPCYWPARPSAPCSHPSRCFHNPPCRAPRIRQRVPLPSQYRCPSKCSKNKDSKCTNEVCPGHQLPCCTNQKTKKNKKRKHTCECSRPTCASCFVTRPVQPHDVCKSTVLNLICDAEVKTVIKPTCSKCNQV